MAESLVVSGHGATERSLLRQVVRLILIAGVPLGWTATAVAPGAGLPVPATARPATVAPPGFLGIVTGNGAPEVTGVVPASPAQKAGILPGDLLIAINGVTVEEAAQVRELIALRRAGERVLVRLRRGDDLFEVGVVLQGPPGRRPR